MLGKLKARLEAQPDALKGWVMLARSYETLERYDAAAQAYRQALQEARRSQMDEEVQARLWAELADALASAHGGDLDGEARQARAVEQSRIARLQGEIPLHKGPRPIEA